MSAPLPAPAPAPANATEPFSTAYDFFEYNPSMDLAILALILFTVVSAFVAYVTVRTRPNARYMHTVT